MPIPVFNDERFDYTFYETIEGGILSKDRTKIYFIGIIDTLTHYGAKKMTEYTMKQIVWGKTISCLPPKQYGDRFFNYMKTIIE